MSTSGHKWSVGRGAKPATNLAEITVDLGLDVLLDTGFLVAPYARNHRYHAVAMRWLAGLRGRLHSVEPVLTEATHLLPWRMGSALAGLVVDGSIEIHPLDTEAYRRIAVLAHPYADREPDWADLALIWLAESTGLHRIATLDVDDFGVYRIHGRKRFELELPG